MTPQVLQLSIKGINREIRNRQTSLLLRKKWFIDPVHASNQYTWEGFYKGAEILKEMKKLQVIKMEMYLLLAKEAFYAKDIHNLFVR